MNHPRARSASRVQITLAFVLIGGISAIATTRPASASSLEDFGRCLARKGATFYGASWCPHCSAQRRTLGDAMQHVRYVECSVDGHHDASANACTAAHVDGYPTWIFADGSRESGEQSLADLASKTGCTLSSGNGAGTPNAKKPDDSGHPSGPKIIEVPH
ncbi:MAG TPA: hypothetical protein VN634_19365 [Candidatus Limnocylindrales bacterium]|nr:hypothetical protein [Candidatus Limnocylindrales bacterium]